jgi:hypothetical protein
MFEREKGRDEDQTVSLCTRQIPNESCSLCF